MLLGILYEYQVGVGVEGPSTTIFWRCSQGHCSIHTRAFFKFCLALSSCNYWQVQATTPGNDTLELV